MDIVNSCKFAIQEILEKLDPLPERNGDGEHLEGCSLQTQSLMDASPEHDKNLNRILEQQNHLKMIIDRDEQIKMLRKSINENITSIDRLRKMCSKIATDALRNREADLKAQSDNIEKFQVAQLKSIAEDYNRHKDILAKRKDEIVTIRKEIEREESGRDSYLRGFEKKLEKHLRDRQMLRGGASGSSGVNIGNDNPLLDELNNPSHLELTSVDEYAPYGLAPHSRIDPGPSKSTNSRGRGRGRRRGGAGGGGGAATSGAGGGAGSTSRR